MLPACLLLAYKCLVCSRSRMQLFLCWIRNNIFVLFSPKLILADIKNSEHRLSNGQTGLEHAPQFSRYASSLCTRKLVRRCRTPFLIYQEIKIVLYLVSEFMKVRIASKKIVQELKEFPITT